jgi:adenosylcobinamide kinase/adenosylcobinamide-phosphate guanylyltransferase
MTILVLGPNSSGKSAYAEKLITHLSAGPRIYIATMAPYGEEGQARVEKHRKQRLSAGFTTIERLSGVSEIPLPSDSAVLLEDVSNLLSNVMFGEKPGKSEAEVFEDIRAMSAKSCISVLVSIEGLIIKPEYNAETRGYINALNNLNNKLSGFADTVVSMNNGTPTAVKGNAYAMD